MAELKKKPTMADRLLVKLRKMGLTKRKAEVLAKGLAPTATRATVSGTVTGKLEARLLKLGLSARRAKEVSKVLAPTVRAAIKAKVRAQAISLDDVDDQMVNDAVEEAVRVRFDLPVAPMTGEKWIVLLRIMDGLSSTATYLVAAVKGDRGIVAVRQLHTDLYNVKFYPNMAYWEKTPGDLYDLGAGEHLQREWYERVHCSQISLEAVLRQLAKEAKPKSRMTKLVDRFKTVAASTLLAGFVKLHARVRTAVSA